MYKESTVKVLAGTLGGKKICSIINNRLRPTPIRIRETLFNWLLPVIKNSVVLDLFAGTGILGFESYSRGAKFTIMLEKNTQIYSYIICNKNSLTSLVNYNIKVLNIDAFKWLDKYNSLHPYVEIVFMDPPYNSNYLKLCFYKLVKSRILVKNALIYFELSNPIINEYLPDCFHIIYSKKAGNVFYFLAKYYKRVL